MGMGGQPRGSPPLQTISIACSAWLSRRFGTPGGAFEEQGPFAFVVRERCRAPELVTCLVEAAELGQEVAADAHLGAVAEGLSPPGPWPGRTPSPGRPPGSAPRPGTVRAGRAPRRAPRCAPSRSPRGYAPARGRRRSRPATRRGRARRRAPRHAPAPPDRAG